MIDRLTSDFRFINRTIDIEYFNMMQIEAIISFISFYVN